MHLRELRLIKYGSIAKQTLHLGQQPGLSIIYGPNEAGKSTSLAALTDFLFGIPNISAHTAIFGHGGMRIGASLDAADGRTYVLERRRGRGKTLVDADGVLQDDDVLRAMLGTTTRERFETLFGLNHTSLRTGGEKLLAADGEIGRLIVEAGGGLSELVGRLAEIEAEAMRQFSPHLAKHRAFYQAHKAYHAAQATIDRLELSHAAFVRAEAKWAQAQRDRDQKRQARNALGEAAAMAKRLTQVVPRFVRLDQIALQLEQDKDVTGFGAAFDARFDKAMQNKAQAQKLCDDARVQAQAARAERDALPGIDADVLAAESEIRSFEHQARGFANTEQKTGDIKSRIRKAGHAQAQLCAQLGLDPASPIAEALPEASAVDHLRGAIDACRRHAPLESVCHVQRDTLKQTHQALEARIAAAIQNGVDVPLPLHADSLRTIPEQDADLTCRTAQLDARRAHLAQSAQTLGAADIQALRALRCPSAKHLERALREDARLVGAIEQAAAAQVTQRAELGRLQTQVAALGSQQSAVSDADVHAARAARDKALVPLAQGFVTGELPARRDARQTRLTQYETAAAHADAVTDDRHQEARRTAKRSLYQDRLKSVQAALDEAVAREALMQTTRKQHMAVWCSAFAEASALEPTLVGLQQFAQTRHELLVEAQSLDDADDELGQARARHAPNMARLTEAERRLHLTSDSRASLVQRVDAAIDAIGKYALALHDLMRDRSEAAALQSKLAAQNAALSAMQREAAALQQAYAQALGQAALAAETTWDTASHIVTLWTQARQAMLQSQHDNQQLSQLLAQAQSVTQAGEALAAKLKCAQGAHPAATADMLMHALQQAQQLAQKRRHVDIRLEQLTEQTQSRAEALVHATAQLDALCAQAQVTAGDMAALRRAAARFTRYQALCQERDALEHDTLQLSDGHPAAHLRALWQQRDAQALADDFKSAQQARLDIDPAVEAAAIAEQQAKDVLAQFEGDNGVNLAHVERSQATADLHAAAERYVELSVAKELIGGAMTSLRSVRKSPLVERASALFAITTSQRYAGVDTDVDDKGEPIVVGRRPDGSTVKVGTMSDGTRDQLFLAFRLASLEQYASQAEALPLIADDILVHFDDARGAATLAVLADFAKKTQVLLFTHHKSVVDAAGPLVAQKLAQVVCLGPG